MKYNTLLFPRKADQTNFSLFLLSMRLAVRLVTDDSRLCQTDGFCRHVCFFPRPYSESGAVTL